MQNVESTTSDKITLKLYEHNQSQKIIIPKRTINCPFCHRKYELIKFPDFNWVKRKLKPTNTMLEKFKMTFPNSAFDLFYENILGITKPQIGLGERVLRHRHYHICFELEGIRAYVDCQEAQLADNTILQGLDIYEA
ncbi:MAG: hypothetical protein ABSG33_05265 [Candidatus Bathyarchaeia archaeon]